MRHTCYYASPMGEILLAADEEGLTGLWFVGQKYFPEETDSAAEGASEPLEQAIRWLDRYFAGEVPSFLPKMHMVGTLFQKEVWKLLLTIPYGQTVSYGHLAKLLAASGKMAGVSAQAVGGAVGRNPISVIVPCHRVVAANGALTGYAAGLEKKRLLLALEGRGDGTADFCGK